MKDQEKSITSRVLQLERSLRVPVNIPHDEVDRIVVNRLISIRNSESNESKDMSHIDKTIKVFLTEDEFTAHVICNKPL